MSHSNAGLWAAIPGDAKIQLYRNISFFEFGNALDVVFRGSKP